MRQNSISFLLTYLPYKLFIYKNTHEGRYYSFYINVNCKCPCNTLFDKNPKFHVHLCPKKIVKLNFNLPLALDKFGLVAKGHTSHNKLTKK